MTEDHISSTHPPLPPTTEDDRFAWLRLLRSRRVGISTFYRLMGEHGSAQAALEALPDVARAAGVDGYEICPEGVILKEFKAAKLARARLICRGEPLYPATFKDLPDAPPLFWAVGDTGLLSRPSVAIVGARNASSLGLRMAKTLAGELGQAGYTVVSGLARGIDTAAHIASLQTGTVAVFAGGVDVLYPSENAKLAEDMIAAGGLRISEQPMGLQPQARHFPMRNRLISGLSRAVVVVEAAAKSGSLITAKNALDQGRDVFAVPGHPMDTRASGCNMLIRDGAVLVRNAQDILDEVQSLSGSEPEQADLDLPVAPPPPQPRRSKQETQALHQDILDRLGPSPVSEDQLIRDLNLASSQVSPALTEMELEGRLKRLSGGMLALAV
ncbi:DNA processing protein [Thalassococcus halodurans]|uniref:DNA processing protein n=1 Tax=Thalassococcus halodurans TaxID=373675 RepID=A0A1H5T3E2_9RHOB|nr:DNA-processing protein DprA [Thalassococcus halodurans]SEF56557.1 DNA processing protein [Thalassococcus halodurans]